MFYRDAGNEPISKSKSKKRKALLLILKSLDRKLYKKAKKILKEGGVG